MTRLADLKRGDQLTDTRGVPLTLLWPAGNGESEGWNVCYDRTGWCEFKSNADLCRWYGVTANQEAE